MADMLLDIKKVKASYGKSRVLHDIFLHVSEGERVFVFGRNGVGKTTLLRAILGIDSVVRYGQILFAEEDIISKEAYYIAQKGVGYVPQGRRLFSSLSVDENLKFIYRRRKATNASRARRWTPDVIYELFPELVKRRNVSGTKLSGGEQQMLAIGRALVGNPSLLMMDEPTEGLAPVVGQRVVEICAELADQRMALLVTAPDLLMSHIAERVYILAKGEVVYEAEGRDFLDDEEIQRVHLGV